MRQFRWTGTTQIWQANVRQYSSAEFALGYKTGLCISIPRSENRSSGPFGKKLQTENRPSGTKARPIPAAGKRCIRRLLLRECLSYSRSKLHQNCIKIAVVPRNPFFHLLTFFNRPLCMHTHEANIFVYLWKTMLYHAKCHPKRYKKRQNMYKKDSF